MGAKQLPENIAPFRSIVETQRRREATRLPSRLTLVQAPEMSAGFPRFFAAVNNSILQSCEKKFFERFRFFELWFFLGLGIAGITGFYALNSSLQNHLESKLKLDLDKKAKERLAEIFRNDIPAIKSTLQKDAKELIDNEISILRTELHNDAKQAMLNEIRSITQEETQKIAPEEARKAAIKSATEIATSISERTALQQSVATIPVAVKNAELSAQNVANQVANNVAENVARKMTEKSTKDLIEKELKKQLPGMRKQIEEEVKNANKSLQDELSSNLAKLGKETEGHKKELKKFAETTAPKIAEEKIVQFAKTQVNLSTKNITEKKIESKVGDLVNSRKIKKLLEDEIKEAIEKGAKEN